MERNEQNFAKKTFTQHHFQPGTLVFLRTSSEGALLDMLGFAEIVREKWCWVLTVLAKFYSFIDSKI